MHVTKTKRLVQRDVNVPNYLIPDLHAYIDGERKECIAVGRRYWIKKKSDEPKALFVNGVDARQNAGKPVSADTLSGAFRRAVIKAGVTEWVTKTDPNTSEVRQVPVPRHRYQDLAIPTLFGPTTRWSGRASRNRGRSFNRCSAMCICPRL